MTSNFARYQRIASFHDMADYSFERRRYRALRPLLFHGLGGRLLEYVRPQRSLRRIVSRIWQPWIAWAYGASFDRNTEHHVPASGLELVESRYVVDDLVKLATLRVG